MNRAKFEELLYQALETELGGVQIYEAALRCVKNDELKEEWEKYLEQTRRHVELLREGCATFGLDPDEEAPGREVVRHIGESFVKAIELAVKQAAWP